MLQRCYWKYSTVIIIGNEEFTQLYDISLSGKRFHRVRGIIIQIQPSQSQHCPHQQARKVFTLFVESMLCSQMKKNSTPGLRLCYVYKSTLYQQN